MADVIDIRHYLPFTKTGLCRRLESGIELELEDESFRVTVLQDDLFLLTISHGGRWDAIPGHGVCADIASMKAELALVEDEEEVRLTTTAITLLIFRKPFRLEAFRPDGTVIFSNRFRP